MKRIRNRYTNCCEEFIENRFSRPVLALLLISGCSIAAEIDYPPVDSNVDYASVVALDFRPADVSIPYGNDALQYGLLWLPESVAQQSIPALITLIHGGCWLNAYDIQHTYALSTALAQAGYAVWSLEYRRTGDAGGGWPGSLEDIQSGLAHINELQNYALNDVPVILAGHSAGGHLSLLAGAQSTQVQAIIGMAAISDIVSYAEGGNSCQTAAPSFMGADYISIATQYHAANPVEKTYLPAVFLLHGDADQIVPLDQSTMSGANTVIVDGAGHFDWVHPGTSSFQQFLKTLENSLKP